MTLARRLALLSIFLTLPMLARAGVDEVSLPIMPFVFDHQWGLTFGTEIRLTNGLGLALSGMAGRIGAVDGLVTPSRGDDALTTWPHPQPVAYHVDEHSATGIAFTLRVPVWRSARAHRSH